MKTLLLALFTMALAGYSAENLISNPGFEEGVAKQGENILAGWRVRGVGGVWKYHHIVGENPHGGTKCALIRIPETAPVGTECYFTLEKNLKPAPNKTYRLSFWAKCTSGKAFLRLVTLTEEGKYWNSKDIPIPADSDAKEWKSYSVDVKVKAPRQFAVSAMLTGHGELYLDDFVWEEVVSAK